MDRPRVRVLRAGPRVLASTARRAVPCGFNAGFERSGNCHNRCMFFRRRPPAAQTAAERFEALRRAGFAVSPQSGAATRITRGACAIDAVEDGGILRASARAGKLIDSEIGALVDGGFQKFFRSPSGRRVPATAQDLQALHDFEEDLKECLAQESYYNESLGTVSTYYQYDRVKDRDSGVPKRAWE